MPRYTIQFEEYFLHRLNVEIEADDEFTAYQKVYKEDFNVSEPVLEGIELHSKRVLTPERVIVVPIDYNGPFM